MHASTPPPEQRPSVDLLPALRLSIGLVLTTLGCASTPGDDVKCPTCNNKTEVLVGTKCVPIAQVETCGPDGHGHGTECHCFSGQQPTRIADKAYCLQQGCGGSAADPEVLACDEVVKAAEAVVAVDSLASVDDAHLLLGRVVSVTLPVGRESFAHFEADEAGDYHVYADTTGVVAGALTEAGTALVATKEGANARCTAKLPDVHHVEASAAGAVVLRFAAGTVPNMKLVIYEGAHAK